MSIEKELLEVFNECDVKEDRDTEANINFRTFLLANYSIEYLLTSYPHLSKHYDILGRIADGKQ